MKLSATLLVVGVAILGYAYLMAPYTDEALFMERYMALSVGQNAEYWQLRDDMLTPKFQLQDYGSTLIALAAGAFLISRKGWRNLKSPHSRAALFTVALGAPILTIGAYIFDLFLRFERGEFPHWADSMGIPLMGAPMLLFILLAWAGAHLAFLRSPYRSSLLSQATSLKANWWLFSVAAITAVLVLLCVSVGQYWYAIPGTVWLYFYVSLAAARRLNHDAEPSAPRDALQAACPGASTLSVMTIDSLPLNESQAQARERLVLLCQEMLSGELSFFEGAIQVCSLRFKVGVPEFDSDLMAFVAIECETDHLPPRHVQHHWSAAALQGLQPEFERTEIWAKGFASQACHNIIERFSHQ